MISAIMKLKIKARVTKSPHAAFPFHTHFPKEPS